MEKPRLKLAAAAKSDIGRKREQNQDAYAVNDDLALYIVADGMGGHQAGEVASQLTVKTVERAMELFHLDTPVPGEGEDPSLTEDGNRLLACIQAANHEVHTQARNHPKREGMGSTVAAAYFTGHNLITANVGDTSIHLFRSDRIEPLSMLHTVANELGPNDAREAPFIEEKYRHILTRAIGVGPQVTPDVFETQFYGDDRIVICTDGLTRALTSEEIRNIALANDPRQACQILVDEANNRGGDDNITVLIIWVEPGPTKWQRFWKFMNEPRVFGKNRN